ncbi:PGM1-C domain-containing protein [Sulfidibacter corallicola]|uniref:ATP-grasp domain-containing protein n=1 Tax=Sulfidibacter corallicola TaxID=2818388 RepID=A0A8A4U073_SULCO|nr:peptide ligase PGM1-related protein [Sulfidibacter corallicola]QTD52145.1 hypothetical protein J3U87_06690 [Sulfidibacter corallicola]
MLRNLQLSPTPGSPEELTLFNRVQERLAHLFRVVFDEPDAPRTVVVIPSLSLDHEVLQRISGVHHYEERMLCMLMLLRLPRTRLIYITSQSLDVSVIDYFLNLLPGVPVGHARKRLLLFNCHDASGVPLSLKLLQRPRLLERIRRAIPDPLAAHLTCFNVTPLERTLAVQMGIPLYGCNPVYAEFGSKTGSREVFHEAGIDLPPGFENLRDKKDMIDSLVALRLANPHLRKAVVKLNEGFSGEGNAIFRFEGCPEKEKALQKWLGSEVAQRLEFQAKGESWDTFSVKFAEMGGVVEAFIEGEGKRSPSVQCRVNPLGEPMIVSTHDQILDGQVFLGCTFPADEVYRLQIQAAGQLVADVLARRGVIGRFGVDFISVPEADGWRHYAIEINLRKGGTTHPFMMLQYLTDGEFDLASGLYLTPSGQPRYYYATDNLHDEAYIGLSPEDLIDISVCRRLHFHGATQQGVVFHLIGALSEFGKLGAVCIAENPSRAFQLYHHTVDTLQSEGRSQNMRVNVNEAITPLVG